VARDADPLVAELRKRGIPHVVEGLNRLFDSAEILPTARLSNRSPWTLEHGTVAPQVAVKDIAHHRAEDPSRKRMSRRREHRTRYHPD
jgi:hypothetical protein